MPRTERQTDLFVGGRQRSLTLSAPGTRAGIELPVVNGSIGPSAADVGALYRSSGGFTFDPGFKSTAGCKSAITFIDGEKGELLHRGYPIEQLARQSDYLELAYLLLNGELPDARQKEDFAGSIMRHTMVHEQMATFFRGFRRDAHPMAILCGVVGALSAFYHHSMDIDDEDERRITAHRLIAKMPTMGAMAYKYALGQPFMYPRNDLGYAANLLQMCFAVPAEDYEVDPVLAQAMDRILMLHADHEQNASTSTVRLAGSTGANPFACIAAGVAALWGPAHGGANQACLSMLEQIGSKDRIPEFLARAKDKNDPFRLMGFGHRVYKNYDPRAKIMRETCHAVIERLGSGQQPLLELAMELERIALEDEYFVEKQLYPNVDFYSGITLGLLGFPKSMFSVIFAIGRTAGWISQWTEMVSSPDRVLGRPRQIYTGAPRRDYVPLEHRGGEAGAGASVTDQQPMGPT